MAPRRDFAAVAQGGTFFRLLPGCHEVARDATRWYIDPGEGDGNVYVLRDTNYGSSGGALGYDLRKDVATVPQMF